MSAEGLQKKESGIVPTPDMGPLARTLREESDQEHKVGLGKAIEKAVDDDKEEVDAESQRRVLHQMIQRMSMRLADERDGKK